MARYFVIFIACLAASAARAAEVLLHPQVMATGSVVLLGDLAEINAEDESLRSQLASMPLTPAPAAGMKRYLRLAEIRDMVASRGVDVRNVRFGGTAIVAITAEPETTNQASVQPALVRPAVRSAEEIDMAAQRLTVAITNHLRKQTGHELWNVRVEADGNVVSVVENTGERLQISGGVPPWTGRQRLAVIGADRQPAAVLYARIERLEMAVFALQPINRGDLIRRADVELRPHRGALPLQAVVSLDTVVGQEAIQGIRPNSLIQANQVRTPVIVRRNERVSVRARAAGVSVRTYAIAQQDGGLGDLVMVQSVANKERYAARVIGLRELEIFTAGASATDVAANPPTVR